MTQKKNLLWFIILRLILFTSLLLSAVTVQYSAETSLINPLYVLIFVAYMLSVVYLLLYFWGKRYDFQAYVQILFDLLLITVLVYLAGGLRGSFYFLYIFEIIAASIVISGRAAYVTAAASSIFFGILVDGMYLGFIPYFDSNQKAELSFAFVVNHILIAWGVFFLVAYLINYLTGSLNKARQQLVSAQKELELRQRLAVAGEFSAQLAHEIRNPLAAISGSVQVLRDELVLTGEQKGLMDIVVDESDRISQAIEQFLSLASPGKQTFSWINLSALMHETLVLLQRSGGLNGRTQLMGNYGSAGIEYYGNRNQFKQIFWNLLKNSLKAMPDGGELNVDFNRNQSQETILMFSDTGLGMKKEARDRLFEPFYSGFSGGMGIGMAVVRRIVDDYSGKIEVESVPGGGTTVAIILPPCQPLPSENPAEEAH
jgi:two-component system sensor histidine kinase PilS (NtrC family)